MVLHFPECVSNLPGIPTIWLVVIPVHNPILIHFSLFSMAAEITHLRSPPGMSKLFPCHMLNPNVFPFRITLDSCASDILPMMHVSPTCSLLRLFILSIGHYRPRRPWHAQCTILFLTQIVHANKFTSSLAGVNPIFEQNIVSAFISWLPDDKTSLSTAARQPPYPKHIRAQILSYHSIQICQD